MKTTPPRWDMITIFSSFDGDDYKNACAQCVKDIDVMGTILKDIPNFGNDEIECEKWLKNFFAVYNACGSMMSSLASYTYCMYSTDTNDTEALNAISKLEEIEIEFSQVGLALRDILALNKELVEKTSKNSKELERYSYILHEEAFWAQKQMSPELEKLASDMQRTGGNAWGRLQEQIIANLVDTKTGKTFNEIRNDAYSSDKNIRKTSYETEIALLKLMEIPIAAALNNIKGESITLNKRVKWESALAQSCVQSRISDKTLNALIGSIEKSLPFWQEYLHTKAKLLGQKELNFFDMFAPLENKDVNSNNADSLVSRNWEFDEAKDYIIEKFNSFSSELGDFAKYAFDNNWIDAEVRKGKVGGAYCTSFSHHKQSRVLSNFTGSFSDITTLAHELGHAYHQYVVENMDFVLTEYPMTLAETACIFCETIIQQDVMKNTEGFEKASIIEMRLQDSCQVLVDILSRFYFEKSVFEKRQDGELSALELCDLMLDAQERSYGNGLAQKHEYMWAVKGHYYSPGLHYYNFPYAFGMLFASALYSRFQKEGVCFAETYKSILLDTGRLTCEEVCKNAGFDIESQDFWDSGIELFKEDLAILKNYCQVTSKN